MSRRRSPRVIVVVVVVAHPRVEVIHAEPHAAAGAFSLGFTTPTTTEVIAIIIIIITNTLMRRLRLLLRLKVVIDGVPDAGAASPERAGPVVDERAIHGDGEQRFRAVGREQVADEDGAGGCSGGSRVNTSQCWLVSGKSHTGQDRTGQGSSRFEP